MATQGIELTGDQKTQEAEMPWSPDLGVDEGLENGDDARCQRPRQNPHRRPIELPTDGQRNSPGTATGIPQERTAMSSPSTT